MRLKPESIFKSRNQGVDESDCGRRVTVDMRPEPTSECPDEFLLVRAGDRGPRAR